MELCQIHALTGLNCPGCGNTRLVLSLTHGEIYQAFRYNPWFFITAPIIAILWLLLFRKHKEALTQVMKYYFIGCCIFGVLRNLPMFYFLSPTVVP